MNKFLKSKVCGKTVLLVVIAFCSVALTSWEDAINTPCLADIYAEFSSASTFLKGYVITGPNLLALPFILWTGKLAKKYSKKTIILTANIFYTIGGVGGAFSPSMLWFAVCRTIVGVSIGIESVAIMGLLFELFPKTEDSARVMGIYQGVNTVYGSLIAVAAGQLGVFGWRAAQLLNGLSVLSMLAIIFFAPKTPPEGKETVQQEEVIVDHPAQLQMGKLILSLAEASFFIIFSFIFYYFSSVYVAERGIGNSKLSGWIASLMLFGASVANFMLAALVKKLKRYTGIVCVAILSLGFVLIGLDTPIWVLIPFALVNGAVCGVIGAYYPIAVNECVPTDKITLFQSIYNCAIFAAYYMCSYVPSGYQAIFDIGYHKIMLANGIVLFVIMLVFAGIVKKYTAAKI